MSIVKATVLPIGGNCEAGLRLKAALGRLEPCVRKLTSTVLMGLGFSNEPWLPDHICRLADVAGFW